MPFVQIFHGWDADDARAPQLGDGVHRALVDAFGIPPDDHFQALCGRADGMSLRITPAGLLEAADSAPDVAPDLRLRADASRPLDAARRVVAGELPPLQIEGDVTLAADVNWVVANVRWDIAADIERVFGPLVAGGLAQAGEKIASTARSLAESAASVLRKP